MYGLLPVDNRYSRAISHYPVAISALSVHYMRTNPLLNRDHPLISGGYSLRGACYSRANLSLSWERARDPVSVDVEGVLTEGAVEREGPNNAQGNG